ncbi:SAVMC3_10250 family protein [Amycolatopsis sp. NPDC051045]|uniref:SAVMC3_10250 family protein n=1 Tax=Amycolatopsis sp. NPDC051045 TaxID=3156922 RepID=UPI00341DFA8A
MFHEYVYLSDAKLRQFVPSEPSWWSRLRVRKFAGKARVASLETSVEIDVADVADAEVRKLIDHLGEDAQWYRQDGLIPGTWVFFEGRIGYQSLPEGAALFCEAGSRDKTSTRIMLHGSANHLVGRTAAGQPNGSYSHIDDVPSVLHSAVAKSVLPGDERAIWARLGRRHAPAPRPAELADQVEAVFRRAACTDSYFDAAPYLAGCARVSAVVRPAGLPFDVVVASPLFVRHARP